jgi:small subunit ribosomal protein S8
MAVSDPIGDFIIQLKNASAVKKDRVLVGYSQLLFTVAETLKERGFVADVDKKGRKGKKLLEVTLAYRPDGSAVLTDVKRHSKPGRRLYGKSKEMHSIRNGKGVMVVSTPAGVMSAESAKERKVGGELLFSAW